MSKIRKIIFGIICILCMLRLGYALVLDNTDRQLDLRIPVEAGINNWELFGNVTQECRFNSDKLYEIDLLMEGVGEGVPGSLDITLSKEGTTVYEGKLDLASMDNGWWTPVYMNVPIDINSDYMLSITASDIVTEPNIAVDENGNVAIAYGYLKHSTRVDKIIYILICLAVMLLAYIVLSRFETIEGACVSARDYLISKIKLYNLWIALEVILALIIIEGSKIDFQNSTKIMIIIISVVSAIGVEEKKHLVTGINKYARMFLYAYTAFAFVGQRLLLFPLNKNVTVVEVFVFAVTILWSIPVVDSITYLLHQSKICLDSKNKEELSTVKFSGIAGALLIVPALLNLIANNPGISLQDTMTNMLENAHNIRGMLDWHPAIYAMFLRVIEIVWDSPYAVIAVQYALWVYVMLEFILYIRKKSIKDMYSLLFAFLSGISASNFVLLNTILKDILYTYCLLWVVIIIAKLTIDYEEYIKKWYLYIEFVVALVGIYMLRKNGIVTFILIAGSLLIVCRKNIKIWVSVLASIVMIGLITGPLYNYFEVEPTGRFGMYIGLSQDILGVYYNDGNVSEDTLSMINVMTEGDNAGYNYTPTWSFSSYYLDVPPTEFILNYIDTFIKNPGIMTRAIIARVDGVWNVFDGQEATMVGVNSTGTMEQFTSWREFYPNRIETALYEPMLRFTTYTAENQWIAALVWRVGISVICGLVAIIYLISMNGWKRYVCLVAPHIGQVLSLLLSTGWSEFRYFWPFNLMNMFLIALVVILLREDIEKQDEAGNF